MTPIPSETGAQSDSMPPARLTKRSARLAAMLASCLSASPAVLGLFKGAALAAVASLVSIVTALLVTMLLCFAQGRRPLRGGVLARLWSILYYCGGSLLALGIALRLADDLYEAAAVSLVSTPLEGMLPGLRIGAALLVGSFLVAFMLALPGFIARLQLSGRLSSTAAQESLWFAGVGWSLVAGATPWVISRFFTPPDTFLLFGSAWLAVAAFVTSRILLSRPEVATPTPLIIVMLESDSAPFLYGLIGRFAGSWSDGPVTLLAPASAARRLCGMHARTAARADCLKTLFPGSAVALAETQARITAEADWKALPVRECYAADAVWPECFRVLLTPQTWVVLVAESHDPVNARDARKRFEALRPIVPLNRTLGLTGDFIAPPLQRLRVDMLGSVSDTSPAELAAQLRAHAKPVESRRILIVCSTPQSRYAAGLLLRSLIGRRDIEGRLIDAELVPLMGAWHLKLLLPMIPPWRILWKTEIFARWWDRLGGEDATLVVRRFRRAVRRSAPLSTNAREQRELVLVGTPELWTKAAAPEMGVTAAVVGMEGFTRVIAIAVDSAPPDVRNMVLATHFAGTMGLAAPTRRRYSTADETARRILDLELEAIERPKTSTQEDMPQRLDEGATAETQRSLLRRAAASRWLTGSVLLVAALATAVSVRTFYEHATARKAAEEAAASKAAAEASARKTAAKKAAADSASAAALQAAADQASAATAVAEETGASQASRKSPLQKKKEASKSAADLLAAGNATSKKPAAKTPAASEPAAGQAASSLTAGKVAATVSTLEQILAKTPTAQTTTTTAPQAAVDQTAANRAAQQTAGSSLAVPDAANAPEAPSASQPLVANEMDFIGEWRNANPKSRSVTRVSLRGSSSGLALQIWGRCNPSDCDWGTVIAAPFKEKVPSRAGARVGVAMLEANFHQGFAERQVRLRLLDKTTLEVDVLTHFTDASGRADYAVTEEFKRSE
ncbi:hypothetical protein [Paraburkholderia elongata]|uniref:Transmembrane protein n=1 Tax=Paraburkholderia elongata TaxID=2675747 RepID=A0A972NQU9_9BURK|nr:hypothetical protein [Paraburkholderia elongata]NPT56734.1 hypothetical protein [Paraburkholderia elongata]